MKLCACSRRKQSFGTACFWVDAQTTTSRFSTKRGMPFPVCSMYRSGSSEDSTSHRVVCLLRHMHHGPGPRKLDGDSSVQIPAASSAEVHC